MQKRSLNAFWRRILRSAEDRSPGYEDWAPYPRKLQRQRGALNPTYEDVLRVEGTEVPLASFHVRKSRMPDGRPAYALSQIKTSSSLKFKGLLMKMLTHDGTVSMSTAERVLRTLPKTSESKYSSLCKASAPRNTRGNIADSTYMGSAIGALGGLGLGTVARRIPALQSRLNPLTGMAYGGTLGGGAGMLSHLLGRQKQSSVKISIPTPTGLAAAIQAIPKMHEPLTKRLLTIVPRTAVVKSLSTGILPWMAAAEAAGGGLHNHLLFQAANVGVSATEAGLGVLMAHAGSKNRVLREPFLDLAEGTTEKLPFLRRRAMGRVLREGGDDIATGKAAGLPYFRRRDMGRVLREGADEGEAGVEATYRTQKASSRDRNDGVSDAVDTAITLIGLPLSGASIPGLLTGAIAPKRDEYGRIDVGGTGKRGTLVGVGFGLLGATALRPHNLPNAILTGASLGTLGGVFGGAGARTVARAFERDQLYRQLSDLAEKRSEGAPRERNRLVPAASGITGLLGGGLGLAVGGAAISPLDSAAQEAQRKALVEFPDTIKFELGDRAWTASYKGNVRDAIGVAKEHGIDPDAIARAAKKYRLLHRTNLLAMPAFAVTGAALGGLGADRLLRRKESEAWQRKEGKSPKGGLNEKGRASLRAKGHDIKAPVTAKAAKKSPTKAKRRKSFCARMGGMEGPMKDENGRPTRKAKALSRWDC